jgi:hypothetical protein
MGFHIDSQSALCTLPQENLCMAFDSMLQLDGMVKQRWLASVARRDVGPAFQRALYRAPYICSIRTLAHFLGTLETPSFKFDATHDHTHKLPLPPLLRLPLFN